MSRSAFVIRITSIIFKECSFGHGIPNIRVFPVHELCFGEHLFRVIDVIKDEKALVVLIPDDSFAASEMEIQEDEELGILFTLGFPF
jgi:hypothetical protein